MKNEEVGTGGGRREEMHNAQCTMHKLRQK